MQLLKNLKAPDYHFGADFEVSIVQRRSRACFLLIACTWTTTTVATVYRPFFSFKDTQEMRALDVKKGASQGLVKTEALFTNYI